MGKISHCIVLAGLLGALVFVEPVNAHGYIYSPKSRQLVADERGQLNPGAGCPHCMQGGRMGARTDICGAPGQGGQNVTNMFFGHQATLTAGQAYDFGLYINAQHGGRHWFGVCPLPRQQATQACFDLPQHRLVRADGSYADGKRYYYQPGSGLGGTEGNFTLRFRLPQGISCPDGCIIQWSWAAYQDGALPCEDPSLDVPEDCGRASRTGNKTCDPANPYWQQCAQQYKEPGESTAATENYQNCIDVVILPDGTAPPPSTAPNDTAPPPSAAPNDTAPPPSPSPPPGGGGGNGSCGFTCANGTVPISGCPSTRDKARALCLCKSGLYQRPRTHADWEMACVGGFVCGSSAKAAQYTGCTAKQLFSQETGSCQAAAGVTCRTPAGQ